MRIAIFGLGYIGSVTAACLAHMGHRVIGVDVNADRVATVNAGHSPVVEIGLDELIGQVVAAGRMQASTDAMLAIRDADVSLICVGTPSNSDGSLDLGYIESVCTDIGRALARRESYHVVVVRSTVLPGSTEQYAIPALEAASGRSAGMDFGVCYNPEFLREGNAIYDFEHPEFTLIGTDDNSRAIEIATEVYRGIPASVVVVPIKVAEMVKYVHNAFHALKVAFANEIGIVCKEQGIDSHQVMDIFFRDTRLNLSAAYLRPGFAFGGSCLPKDLRALLHRSRQLDLELSVLEAVLRSNQKHIERSLDLIEGTGGKRVGLLGLSFKDGTGDLRESPLLSLVERLVVEDYEVCIYDREVSLALTNGIKKTAIVGELGHILELMRPTVEDVLAESDVVVVGKRTTEFIGVLEKLRNDQVLVDLVRIVGKTDPLGDRYQGICW